MPRAATRPRAASSSSSSGEPATGRGRRFRGRSAEERKAIRRAQLVAAGLSLFGEKGFHAVGVREICAKAKLTERYFYESFDNREALYRAVYDDAVERARAVVLAAMAEAPAEITPAFVRVALGRYLRLLRDDPRLSRVLLIDVLSVGEDLGTQSLRAARSFSDIVVSPFVQHRADLQRIGIDLDLVAQGMIGSTLFLVMHWASNDFREPLERILEHCALFYEATAEALSRAAGIRL